MPRETLDKSIHRIQEETLLLAGMVENAMLTAVHSLESRDLFDASTIYHDDHLLNEKRFAIENAILIAMATQQPIARDLRLLAAFLEIITELERMGDYAKGVARIVMMLDDYAEIIDLRDVSMKADLAVNMLERAMQAFIEQDVRMASQIPAEDSRVDELFNKVYYELLRTMISDPYIIDRANLLVWVVQYLERMADRVTNICERTVFIVTGELLELNADEEIRAFLE